MARDIEGFDDELAQVAKINNDNLEIGLQLQLGLELDNEKVEVVANFLI